MVAGSVCILAGGLSSRLGRDKAALRLGRRTLLGHIRARAGELGWPVRVLRRDRVPRCGPLGGIYTALLTGRGPAVLFLACDMPFVSRELLEKILAEFQRSSHALFVAGAGRAGFPCVLPHSALPIVRAQLERQQFSMQALARALKGRSMAPVDELDLFNVNTPQDWEQARQFWSERFRPALSSRRPKDGQPPLVIGGRRV